MFDRPARRAARPVRGRSLTLLHSTPTHPWTLEKLAREVVLSRSSLAERFMHLVGEPPMQYLTHWRLQMAAGMLSGGSANLATIAKEVGYESHAAFSRVFKKVVGGPPATWRRQQNQK
jgi:AraC-like DNA-binding protein